jgi:hypothetical protein
MSHAPREWPNVVKDARDRSAEAAVEGIRVLEPVVLSDRPMTETERFRRESVALNCFQRIARLLESVGACTRP